MKNQSTMNIEQIAARFDELARQEKWFEIQDELFAENVRSVEPAHSPYFKNAEGKAAVEKKGRDFVARIEGVNRLDTSASIVAGNHFAVVRNVDIIVKDRGGY